MNSFDNIIGYLGEKKELQEIAKAMRNQKCLKAMNAHLPRGILIYGNPGLGKTTMAKAFVEESGAKPFFVSKRSDSVNMVEYLEKTFEEAIKASEKGPVVILLDDMDSYGDTEKENRVFHVLQGEIDRLKGCNAIVVATANNLGALPRPLIRKGRFDVLMGLMSPSPEEGREIIKHYLKEKPLDSTLNIEDLTRMISYCSCAELESLINQGALVAAFKGKDKIDLSDFTEAYLNEREGRESPDSFSKNEEGTHNTAIHEAGHAAMAELLKKGSVGLVAVGYWSSRETGPSGLTSLAGTLLRRSEKILAALAGKAASELFVSGRCASGCQKDLQTAYGLVYDGISKNGTRGLSLISSYDEDSEALGREMSAAIHAELERSFLMTKEILSNNKDFVLAIAKELEEKRRLHYSDIQRIRGTVKLLPPGQYL